MGGIKIKWAEYPTAWRGQVTGDVSRVQVTFTIAPYLGLA